MPRIKPEYNFVKTVCVSGLKPLPAQALSHAHRVNARANPRQGYSHPPKEPTRGHTANIMANGKYTGKITISEAEKRLIDELGRM